MIENIEEKVFKVNYKLEANFIITILKFNCKFQKNLNKNNNNQI